MGVDPCITKREIAHKYAEFPNRRRASHAELQGNELVSAGLDFNPPGL
jgi:hypothetical protein